MKNIFTKTVFVAIGLILLLPSLSFAAIVVNTGNPSISQYWGFGGSSNQWLAGEFSLNQSYILTDIQNFSRRYSGQGSTIAIYTDGGDIPGSEIFSQTYSVGTTPGWYGLSGLNWNLSAGDYWVAFENRGDFDGTFGAYVPNPMQREAYKNSGGYYPYGQNLSIAVKIDGNAGNVIPEPATMSLLGLGLAGLFGLKKRKGIK